jgi:hypothetical protein
MNRALKLLIIVRLHKNELKLLLKNRKMLLVGAIGNTDMKPLIVSKIFSDLMPNGHMSLCKYLNDAS